MCRSRKPAASKGDLTWNPSRFLTLSATALWLQTEIQDYIGTNAAGQPQNFDSAEFINSPDFQASLSLIFNRELTDALDLQVTLNSRYQS